MVVFHVARAFARPFVATCACIFQVFGDIVVQDSLNPVALELVLARLRAHDGFDEPNEAAQDGPVYTNSLDP